MSKKETKIPLNLQTMIIKNLREKAWLNYEKSVAKKENKDADNILKKIDNL